MEIVVQLLLYCTSTLILEIKVIMLPTLLSRSSSSGRHHRQTAQQPHRHQHASTMQETMLSVVTVALTAAAVGAWRSSSSSAEGAQNRSRRRKESQISGCDNRNATTTNENGNKVSNGAVRGFNDNNLISSSTVSAAVSVPLAPVSLSVAASYSSTHEIPLGIPNVTGSGCFLASVIQCLASIESVIRFVRHTVAISHGDNGGISSALYELLAQVNRYDPASNQSSVTRSLCNFLTLLSSFSNDGKDAHVQSEESPDRINLGRMFQRRYGQARGAHDQQDAQELFARLLAVLVEESEESSHRLNGCRFNYDNYWNEGVSQNTRYGGDGLSSLLSYDFFTSVEHSAGRINNEYGDDCQFAQKNYHQHSTSNLSPFSGWTGSCLQCTSCGHVRPIRNETFLDLPLPTFLNDTGPAITLHECLEAFAAIETVDSVSCNSCWRKSKIDGVEKELAFYRQALKSCTDGDTSALQHMHHMCERRRSALLHLDPDEDIDDGRQDGGIYIDDNEILLMANNSVATTRRMFRKCLLLTRLPAVLALHLQRRHYDRTLKKMKKYEGHVSFPMQLDVAPYCAYHCARTNIDGINMRAAFAGNCEKQERKESDGDIITIAGEGRNLAIPYRLACVIEHRGNADLGHYVVYRRRLDVGRESMNNDISYDENCEENSFGKRKKDWVLISDDQVAPVEYKTVQRCQAYMLFYESVR
uniref:ubiquitinyl hydrolase 1 n=1 Tax=Corethron hystrix TaxID=216773 RepID=A0A7S1FW30_9STRA